MTTDIDHPVSPPLPAEGECREFKAGVGWHFTFILGLTPFLLIFVAALLEGGMEKHPFLIFPFVFFVFIFTHQYLRKAPWSPIYQGPTLVVDSSGVKTGKWFLSWEEIEKFDLITGGKRINVAAYKKGQQSWEPPYRLEGPLGAKFKDVIAYLQTSLDAANQSSIEKGGIQ